MKKFAMVLGVVGLALGTASVFAQAPVELKVGDVAPAFSLPGTDGKTHTLAEYKGKMVVVAWYPKAFTGGCTAECKAFTSSGETIKKFNVAYFMASVDDAETNKKFAEQEQANFPMLSDPDRKVSDAYGVTDGAQKFARRWTFYVGADGKILFIDKAVKTATAGADLAAKLEELGAKKK
ncbi:MAG: peroxiredoxin [Acidobacteriota bacterium]